MIIGLVNLSTKTGRVIQSIHSSRQTMITISIATLYMTRALATTTVQALGLATPHIDQATIGIMMITTTMILDMGHTDIAPVRVMDHLVSDLALQDTDHLTGLASTLTMTLASGLPDTVAQAMIGSIQPTT